MRSNTSRQYTIRNVPAHVDSLLRQRALDSKKSFNQVALEALAAGVGQSTVPKRDYSEIAGSLSDEEAEQIEQDIRSQNQVDAELWK